MKYRFPVEPAASARCWTPRGDQVLTGRSRNRSPARGRIIQSPSNCDTTLSWDDRHYQPRRLAPAFVDRVGRFGPYRHVRPAVRRGDGVGVGDLDPQPVAGLEHVADRPDLDRELVRGARRERLRLEVRVI